MINRCVVLFLLMFLMELAFCQEITETTVPNTSLNPSAVKENLQTSYALKVAQLTINAISTFKQKYHPRELNQNDVNWFTEELLSYGKDNLIETIIYEPEQSLTIVMQNNNFVAPLLRSKELVYQYYPQADQWKIKQELPTIAATRPDSLLRDIGMGLITSYCNGPKENFGFSGMWPDTQWCPAWLQFVMPSPQ